jgi:GWxTD domain-containing protein
MKNYICLVLLIISVTVFGQPLRDIDYAYVYNPDEAFSMQLKPVRSGSDFIVVYSLRVKDTVAIAEEYTIEWQGRAMLSDKDAQAVSFTDNQPRYTSNGIEGSATLPVEQAPKYLVARVIRKSMNRAWMFYTLLDPAFPVNNYLTRNGSAVVEPFVRKGENFQLGRKDGPWIVSYYNDNFPPGAPAFSEAQARVARSMKSDSTFLVSGSEQLGFTQKGLYLIQKDTSTLEGMAFRVEEDYPQYTNVANLAGPMIYISTKQEYDRLEMAVGNKKAFDRVVLSIAIDTERARKLMRSYFRRVELANKYFTSYKEGWKTDRGMIYIIFGMPDEVYKFDDREVWNYNNELMKGFFNFSKSTSLFDPENYVLIRDDKFKDEWYAVIDLWRNARF